MPRCLYLRPLRLPFLKSIFKGRGAGRGVAIFACCLTTLPGAPVQGQAAHVNVEAWSAVQESGAAKPDKQDDKQKRSGKDKSEPKKGVPSGQSEAKSKEEGHKQSATEGKQKSTGPSEQGKQGKTQDEEDKQPANYLLGGQATAIAQNLFRFHSPYAGTNSLRSRGEVELTETNTLFLGARIAKSVEVFVNPEWLLGSGLSAGRGLSGPANGDLHGQGELSNDPYLARAFVRWRIPTGRSAKIGDVLVGRSENLLPGKVPARRVVLTFGKFAASDIFDASRYANDPHTEFISDPLTNNAAYDAAQDTRGYALGLTAAWVNPEFALRLGSFEMPEEAGGARMAGDIVHNRGDQIELDLYPRPFRHALPSTLRLLAFRNFAHMGRYADALALATPGMPPDITKVEGDGRVKFGYGLSMDQPIADDGKTGAFLRYGWNNGATETFAFDEADRTLSLGGQFSGAHWRRADDRIGLAVVQNDLSAIHRNYLAAGGLGLQLGDGALRYGSEQWLETYYLCQVSKPLSLSLHFQWINHPGYNADRGPVAIISLRVHAEFGL
jgi:high affinity Mn2+ porin